MTARTHKEFAISFIYLATFYIYNTALIDINYYILLVIMLCVGAKGALFPDVDHSWNNVKEKTLFNRIINGIIHITGGKHRSWQTHSLDLCIVTFILLMTVNRYLFSIEKLSELNYSVLEMLILAFYSGWVSHLISDMFTVGGVYLLFLGLKKIRLVPRRIGKLEFKTGGDWEIWFYTVNNRLNYLLSFIALLYPVFTNKGLQALVRNWI